MYPKPPQQVQIGIVCAKGLGDGLLYMTLAHHFLRCGYPVSLFSSPLCDMKEWFPECRILPFPKPEERHAVFSSFTLLIAADHCLVKKDDDFSTKLIILKESRFDKKKTLVENLTLLSEAKLHLGLHPKENGIVAPKNLIFRRFPNRIVIHPTSSDPKKNWCPNKFRTLAMSLKNLGYNPVFCVSPHEKEMWPESPLFSKISDVASFVYESGYMIGNDSGIGHLASCLHIPTLTLFARKGYSRLWRPGFGPGIVVSPPKYLIGSKLKQKYWTEALSVNRVLKAFRAFSHKIQGEKR